MAIQGLREEQWLFKRKIDKLVGGAIVDWNSGPVIKKIESTIDRMNKRGALRVRRKARSILRQRAYKTGDLHDTVKAYPSKWGNVSSVQYHKQVMVKWVIYAGSADVDYSMHVETGRYFKDSGTRVAAVPFMRTAAANTRKWLRPRMKEALRRALA